MKKILVLCTGNSCRSQMAEGWLKNMLGDLAEVYSAGLEAHGINPYMKQAMEDAGVNVGIHTSNTMEEYKDLAFDYVITVCDHARDNCPYFQNTKHRISHSFEDPADASGTDEEQLIVYKKVRDQIRQFCAHFVEKEFAIPIKQGMISWFEIPVVDFNRAKDFYENILGKKIHPFELGGIQHGFWEHNPSAIGGAIVKDELKPSKDGVLVYLNGGMNLTTILDKVADAGGIVVLPKTQISPEIGFMAKFEDTEGNLLAIHSRT